MTSYEVAWREKSKPIHLGSSRKCRAYILDHLRLRLPRRHNPQNREAMGLSDSTAPEWHGSAYPGGFKINRKWLDFVLEHFKN